MKQIHRLVWLACAGALVVACAEGTTDTGFGGASQSEQPTEPGNSVPLPSADSGSGTSEQDGDTGTGIDSGTTATDAGSDTGTTTLIDAGSGTCATTPPSNLCGVSPQCGCASNQTCDVTNQTNGFASCILAGGGPLASLCTTSAQCQAGFTCAYGACRPYCGPQGSACATPGTNKCTQFYTPAGTLVPNALVCTIACDPLVPSAKCGSNNCIWDSSVASTDCDKAGPVGVFGSCSSYTDCTQGTACLFNPFYGVNECEPYCRVGHDEDCPFFSFCEDVYPAAAPTSGGAKLGHCQ